MNYYNDNDAFCIQWQKYLAENLFIPGGKFDDRSIQDVQPDDLSGFKQCHFFAGIGGWPRALELVGWPEDREVWTASCPCQPFSVAGKGRGVADDRHLWPDLYRLINQCRPAIVFGEQVASSDGWDWFATVRSDLEKSDYAVGAAGLCAAGVGAPHIRQRIYWVAVRDSQRFNPRACKGRSTGAFGECGGAGGLLNPDRDGLQPGGEAAAPASYRDPSYSTSGDDVGGVSNAERGAPERQRPPVDGAAGEDQGEARERQRLRNESVNVCPAGGVHNPGGAGLEGHAGDAPGRGKPGRNEAETQRPVTASAASTWAGCQFVPCADGKARPIKPGILPVAHGVSNRVGLIKGYGNAIVPQVAAAFIEGVMSYDG